VAGFAALSAVPLGVAIAGVPPGFLRARWGHFAVRDSPRFRVVPLGVAMPGAPPAFLPTPRGHSR
jgi:hypothetical protein